MATYRNTSSEDLSIPGFGVVKAGETADLPDGFHNANFEPVAKAAAEKRRPGRDTSGALENKEADEA